MLRRRYGPLPSWVSPKLQQAAPDQLERWADRLFDVDSLEKALEE